MALIRTSGLISSIRGQVAGSVFQRSNSGLILRSNTTPVNRNTNRQNKTRGFTFRILQEWIRLSDAQRLSWSSFLQYNPVSQRRSNELQLSGQQAFIKFNSYRLEYDLPILLTPIFNKCEITPITLILFVLANFLILAVDRAPVPADEYIILFLTTTRRSSINNPGSTYKIIKFVTTTANAYVIDAPYLAVFGKLPQQTETIFMKYTNASKFSGLLFPFKFEKVLL